MKIELSHDDIMAVKTAVVGSIGEWKKFILENPENNSLAIRHIENLTAVYDKLRK